MSRLFWFTTILLMCPLLCAAEPQPAPKAAAKVATPAGGTSPKEAFEQLRQAVIANDWTTALAQFDEPSRETYVARFAAIPMTGFLGEKGKEIAGPHLTDKEKFLKLLAEINNLPRREQREAMLPLAKLVKDPG